MNDFWTAVAERDTLAEDITAREAAGEQIPLNDWLYLEDAWRAVLVAFFPAALAVPTEQN